MEKACQEEPIGGLLYVLNSDSSSASIQGYSSGTAGLAPIPGSNRLTTSQTSVPAQVRFDRYGQVLAGSERPAQRGDTASGPTDDNPSVRCRTWLGWSCYVCAVKREDATCSR